MYRLIHITSALLLSGFAFQANAEQAYPMLGAAVSEQTLSENRGGYTQFNTNNLNAELYNNQASYNITGTNSINKAHSLIQTALQPSFRIPETTSSSRMQPYSI